MVVSPSETRGRYKERRKRGKGGICDTLYERFTERYWPIAQGDYSTEFTKAEPMARLIDMLSREMNSPVFDVVLGILPLPGQSHTLVPVVMRASPEDSSLQRTYDPQALRRAFDRNLARMSALVSRGVSVVLYVLHAFGGGHAVLVYLDYLPDGRWNAVVRDPNGAANDREELEDTVRDLLEPILPDLSVEVPYRGQSFNFSLSEKEKVEMFAPHKIKVHTGGWCALLAFVHTADVMCSGRGRGEVMDFRNSTFAREFLPTRKTTIAFLLSVVTSMLYLDNEAESKRAVYWFDRRDERVHRKRPDEPRVEEGGEQRKKRKSFPRATAMGATRKRLHFDHVATPKSDGGAPLAKKSLLRRLFQRAPRKA